MWHTCPPERLEPLCYNGQQQDGNKMKRKSESNNIVQNYYFKTPVNFQLQFKDSRHKKTSPLIETDS